MTECDMYRDSVHRLIRARSSAVIGNGQHAHAAILFEAFFKHATKTVKIFCRNLDPQVFDSPEVIEAAVDMLKQGRALDIIIQEKPLRDSKFLKRIRSLKVEEIRLEVHENASADSEIVRSRAENFAVMDDSAYRFEPDRKEPKAVACMNDPALSNQLIDAFNFLRHSIAA